MKETKFSALGLSDALQRALADRKHDIATPIQAQAIPAQLDGTDVLGIAQTGTGKTGAFALPILHKLSQSQQKRNSHKPRALILAPTRELAIQIGDEVKAYAKYLRLKHTVIFGGVGQRPQVERLRRGVDIVIATPGRLLDLARQGHIRLDAVEHFVLDEADRMLDLGFVRDVRKILEILPAARQSLLFSATMPKEITRLSCDVLKDPIRIEVARQATPVERIEQLVYHVAQADKQVLLETLLSDPALSRVIVFSRTKHHANRIAARLVKNGIKADAIHGNKSPRRPATRAGAVQKRRHPSVGGHRYRRPRYRYSRRQPRRQFRTAQRAGKLCPSHRTDGPGRRQRRGTIFLRPQRDRSPHQYRRPDPLQAHGGGRRAREVGGGEIEQRIAATSKSYR